MSKSIRSVKLGARGARRRADDNSSTERSDINPSYVEDLVLIFKNFKEKNVIFTGDGKNDELSRALKLESSDDKEAIKLQFFIINSDITPIISSDDDICRFIFTMKEPQSKKLMPRNKDSIVYKFLTDIGSETYLCTVYVPKLLQDINKEQYQEFSDLLYSLFDANSIDSKNKKLPEAKRLEDNKEQTVELICRVLEKYLGDYDKSVASRTKIGKEYKPFTEGRNKWRKVIEREDQYEIWGRVYIHRIQNLEENYYNLAHVGDRKLYSLFSDFLIERFEGVLNRDDHNTLENDVLAKWIQSIISEVCLEIDSTERTVGEIAGYLSVREDILEAFFGAMYLSFVKLFGYAKCCVMMYTFFNNLFIDAAYKIPEIVTYLENPTLNAVTYLDQTFRNLGFVKEKKNSKKKDRGDKDEDEESKFTVASIVDRTDPKNPFIRFSDVNNMELFDQIRLSPNRKDIVSMEENNEEGVKFMIDMDNKISSFIEVRLTDKEMKEIGDTKARTNRLCRRLQRFLATFGITHEYSKNIQILREIQQCGLSQKEVNKVFDLFKDKNLRIETFSVFARDKRFGEEKFKVFALISIEKTGKGSDVKLEKKIIGKTVSPSRTHTLFILLKRYLSEHGSPEQRRLRQSSSSKKLSSSSSTVSQSSRRDTSVTIEDDQ